MRDYDSITIEPKGDGFAAYGHDTYPRWSVLAGQARRVFLERGTVEELREQFPGARVIDFSTKTRFGSLVQMSGLPDTPPDWFDPADAGESW